MTKHRSLEFDSFVHLVSPDVLERYFNSLNADNTPAGWATLNDDALDHFLNLPENAELAGMIRDDFRKVNDIARTAPRLIIETYDRYEIEYDLERSPQELAILLFLDHDEAWDFAWSRYLLMALDTKVSLYYLQAPELLFGSQRIDAFQNAISHSLRGQSKGTQCEIRMFEVRTHRIFYVERGTYIRSISYWDGTETQIRCYRPVLEDVIAYEPETGELLVKASQESEREDYVRAFAHHFAGDLRLGDDALRSRTFTLEPIARNTFNYQGEGIILGVDLVGIKVRLPFKERGVLELKSGNIFSTLKHFSNMSLDLGELTAARLRFKVIDGKRQKTITFDIAPPQRTDLPDSKFAPAINAYLKRQGVRLR